MAVVDDQHRIAFRPVTTGAPHGDRVEILSGVKPGQRVVATAQALRDGQLVRLAEP